MNMLEEEQRLKDLVGVYFREKVTGHVWRVATVSHNIYKDVCLGLKDFSGKSKELIEGSEEYYKNFERV